MQKKRQESRKFVHFMQKCTIVCKMYGYELDSLMLESIMLTVDGFSNNAHTYSDVIERINGDYSGIFFTVACMYYAFITE